MCVLSGSLKAKYQRDIEREKKGHLPSSGQEIVSPAANRSSVATRAYVKRTPERETAGVLPARSKRDSRGSTRAFSARRG